MFIFQSYCFRTETVLKDDSTQFSMGCMTMDTCPDDGIGSHSKSCTEGTASDDFKSQCTTCSYFSEPENVGDKKAYHCGEVGMY